MLWPVTALSRLCHCPHMAFLLLCLCVISLWLSLIGTTAVIGFRGHLKSRQIPSSDLDLNCICREPCSKEGHILRLQVNRTLGEAQFSLLQVDWDHFFKRVPVLYFAFLIYVFLLSIKMNVDILWDLFTSASNIIF